jgi:DNA-nicking Smr family endonuclease
MTLKKHHPDWAEAVKGVKPLDQGKKIKDTPPALSGRRPVREKEQTLHSFHPTEQRPQSPFDPKLFDKIATGKVKIQFSHDLHGLTQEDAFDALLDVLGTAYRTGRRYGLIVTGKGRDGQSRIRAMVPKWLSSPKLSQIVSSFAYSARRHGGEGAFYVLLRRHPR